MPVSPALVDRLYSSVLDKSARQSCFYEILAALAQAGHALRVQVTQSEGVVEDNWISELNEAAGRVAAIDGQSGTGVSEHRVAVVLSDCWQLSIALADTADLRAQSEATELLRHLRRAHELDQRVSSLVIPDRLGPIWIASPVALILVCGGRVMYANREAERELATGRVVSRAGDSVKFSDKSLNQTWQDSFSNDARLGTDRPPRHARVIQGPHHPRLLVQFSTVTDHAQAGNSTDARGTAKSVLIVMTELDASGAGRVAAIDAFDALTPTEREILAALVGGENVEAIAKRLNRSVQTTRWHIKNIVEKTGSTSLTDAVRIGALLFPV